eukprot:scaffold1439_cov145-Amphora_coffeaeformis.AAC.3
MARKATSCCRRIFKLMQKSWKLVGVQAYPRFLSESCLAWLACSSNKMKATKKKKNPSAAPHHAKHGSTMAEEEARKEALQLYRKERTRLQLKAYPARGGTQADQVVFAHYNDNKETIVNALFDQLHVCKSAEQVYNRRITALRKKKSRAKNSKDEFQADIERFKKDEIVSTQYYHNGRTTTTTTKRCQGWESNHPCASTNSPDRRTAKTS